MGEKPRRRWLYAAVLLSGCNALLGIDEPHVISADAPAVTVDAGPVIDARSMLDAPPGAPDGPLATPDARPDAPPVDAAPIDAAADAARFDAR